MDNKSAKRLKKYATQRQRCYVIKKCMTESRAKAISRIIQVTDHFSNAKVDGWISQIKNEILAILPSEEGKFKNMRQEILNILNTQNP